MKRFLLFMYDTYYPGGGHQDYYGDYDTLEEVQVALDTMRYKQDWREVLDTQTGEWKSVR